MGKKVKKDEKGPPEDVFEALQIESKQAATVVLMLESPEEEVLTKACEAIYRFVEKAEENKKTMLDLDVLEPLLKLVLHEDKNVHRNACMALGSMALHPDVRRSLRKREETIPSMVALLSPEEDSVVHEFAALCLSALAIDFSSKLAIYEQDGLEPLIRLLGSSDPDVQKNAIETISLMLQDYQTKSAIREMNGFPPILDLLKSEFPVIQHLALVALQRATEDSENRAALRELEAINKLIDFIGKPEWSDLHVFAVIVLANCLEDTESMEMIRENGGLSKLVAYITDSQPPEEDDKTKGKAKEKGAASRTGKKGKGGDDGMKDVDHDSAGHSLSGRLSSMRTTMSRQGTQGAPARATSRSTSRSGSRSESRAKASNRSESRAKASSRAVSRSQLGVNTAVTAKHGAHRLSIIPSEASDLFEEQPAADVDQMSISESLKVMSTSPSLLSQESMAVLTKDAVNKNTVSTVAKDAVIKDVFAKELVFMLDEKKQGRSDADPVIATLPEVKEHAAKAIARAAKNADNLKILHEQEAEKMLIHLLSHDDPNVQVSAAQALGVMSENLLSRQAVGEWEGIEPLIKMCKSDNPDVREAASMALANLTSSNTNNCNEVVRFHGIDALVTMLKDSRQNAAANAAMVLTNMAPDESIRSAILQAGVITALLEPLQSLSTSVQSKAALCVSAFCGETEARTLFRESGGIEHLVKLLSSNNDEVRRSASWAISVCAVDEVTAAEISRHGGLAALQQVQLSQTKKNAFTDVALNKLLNSNLSAKYALKGYLAPNNLITDGFFDVGQLRPDASLLTIEDYCKMDINQKRPVLLVNAQPEKPMTPAPQQSEFEVTEKSSKSSIAGRGSRAGRDSKVKSRALREKEEKLKEEEQSNQKDAENMSEQPPFSLPGDPQLLKYIEDVQERIAPLPSTKDQVVALAQYVAEKMGGAIDRGQVANFSWELPISQIKFEIQSNVIPIGLIKQGIHYHRALLFKALGDRIAVHSSLVRGEYNRAWNEVLLTDDDDAPGAPRFPPKSYIVDLIHQPGRLMSSDHPDAINYQKL